MIKIYPSLISNKSIEELKKEINSLEPYCNGFHIDIMDAKFVPNTSFNQNQINKILEFCKKPLFIHFMVEHPESWLNLLNLRPHDIFAFHIESKINHKDLIEKIHKKKLLAAITLNPKTEIDTIFSLAHLADQILIMSVEPGFSGQIFIPETITKLEKLTQFKKIKNLNFQISMDGGINEKNIVELAKKGVQNFAISSAIFKGESLENLKKLQEIVSNIK